ncbi:hypothetical protein AWC38_SpisGene22515 [Stylophora pistillata]|uniref:Uncharacterized protein n=1 Tax=Stylophora pistillata TaxID=50429 RepID=A0A2B4R9B9_STYPI|nr:hypothetical protein AWC38_SpisGene22515 [Stylophora pistillata]
MRTMTDNLLIEVFSRVVFSFTRGVTEHCNPDEPEVETFGYDDNLSREGREWNCQPVDKPIYQEYSPPKEDEHNLLSVGNLRVRYQLLNASSRDESEDEQQDGALQTIRSSDSSSINVHRRLDLTLSSCHPWRAVLKIVDMLHSSVCYGNVASEENKINSIRLCDARNLSGSPKFKMCIYPKIAFIKKDCICYLKFKLCTRSRSINGYIMSSSTLIEVFGHIVFSFTRGVTEHYNPEEPEFTAESFGYDPLESTGREWYYHPADEFIFQEYSDRRDTALSSFLSSSLINARCTDACAPEENEETLDNEQDEDRAMAWKRLRPSALSTVGKAMCNGALISLITATLIGSLFMLITYLSYKTELNCLFHSKESIPVQVQWIISISTYNRQNKEGKLLIAIFAPLVGVVLKVISRIPFQRLWKFTHPGYSYVLLAPVYFGSAFMFRVLQADLDSLQSMATLGVIHGFAEVLERSMMVIIDHFCHVIWKRKSAPWGSFRTHRRERLMADIAIMSMLYESIGLVSVNGVFFLYQLIYMKSESFVKLLQSFAIRTSILLVIEWFFTSVSLAIETHYQNMAVMAVWRKRWIRHILVAIINAVPLAVWSSGNVPVPPKIELSGNIANNWKQWKQVWSDYELVTRLNDQTDEYRVAAFITCIGPKALTIHNGLPFQSEDEKKNLAKIVELWESYCLGKTNIIYKRYRFDNRNQDAGESIDTYAANLRSLSETCNSGALKEEMIRDRIVYGVGDSSLRKKLPQVPEITLDKCIDMCRSAEATSTQREAMSALNSHVPPPPQVNFVKKASKSADKSPFVKHCRFCGQTHEVERSKCPAFGKICSICQRENHFSLKCSHKKKSDKPKKPLEKYSVNQLNFEESEEEILSVSCSEE